jgi:hypothetical protein
MTWIAMWAVHRVASRDDSDRLDGRTRHSHHVLRSQDSALPSVRLRLRDYGGHGADSDYELWTHLMVVFLFLLQFALDPVTRSRVH